MSRKTHQILKMKNPILAYAWGSRSAIAELLGQDSPSPEPQAEIWMGAHPKSPSEVWVDGKWQSLLALIERYPQELLGDQVADRFKKTLPYLFKVLAAAEPLSIQAHPDTEQARDGFHREDLMGLDLSDPKRNYRDDRPKPECICALTPFIGLCGFRSPQEMASICRPVWPASEERILSTIDNPKHSNALQRFYQSLMQLDAARIANLIAQVVEKADMRKEHIGTYYWVNQLHQKYPGDIGVLSPLLLNVIQLEPGEALFLPPKQLHAYLDGLGIELMGNSDNVLRGGLTPKHVDVQELMRILDFRPYKPEILLPRSKSETEGIYASATDTFSLSRLVVTGRRPHHAEDRRFGPEIIFGIEGTAAIQQHGNAVEIPINRGESVFVPPASGTYTVTGNAKLYKAAVNI